MDLLELVVSAHGGVLKMIFGDMTPTRIHGNKWRT
jgi:hypothetical protein